MLTHPSQCLNLSLFLMRMRMKKTSKMMKFRQTLIQLAEIPTMDEKIHGVTVVLHIMIGQSGADWTSMTSIHKNFAASVVVDKEMVMSKMRKRKRKKKTKKKNRRRKKRKKKRKKNRKKKRKNKTKKRKFQMKTTRKTSQTKTKMKM